MGATDDTRMAFLFPGQGSQRVGMGSSLLDVPEVATAFACASDVFEEDLRALCLAGPQELLDDTRNAQAAITALSLGTARALMARGLRPAAVLGFSLGQVAALPVAGIVSDEQALFIVRERARIMAEAVAGRPGSMSALLGGTDEEVERVCADCAQGDVLVPANYNCPGQVVISGTRGAVERAQRAWEGLGRRYRPLNTAGAFHSPLMQDAAVAFGRYLSIIEFREPAIPLICNVDARPLGQQDVRDHLVAHLTSPVRFSDGIRRLLDDGIGSFAEVGYGGVLCGLVKRIDRTARRVCVQDGDAMESLLSETAAGAAARATGRGGAEGGPHAR